MKSNGVREGGGVNNLEILLPMRSRLVAESRAENRRTRADEKAESRVQKKPKLPRPSEKDNRRRQQDLPGEGMAWSQDFFKSICSFSPNRY